jgi:hypothetical protein
LLTPLLGLGAFFLWGTVRELAQNPKEFEHILVNHLDQMLANRSAQENRLDRILNQRFGRCSIHPRVEQRLPFAADFRIDLAGINRVRVACQIPPDNHPVTISSPDPAIVRFYRLRDWPVILEPVEGRLFIISDKMRIAIKIPQAFLFFTAKGPAVLHLSADAGGAIQFSIVEGAFNLEQRLRNHHGKPVPVQLSVGPSASLTVSGNPPETVKGSANLLPSGLYQHGK